ncbi:GrpB family protein [Desulfobotulus sp. H1]|uniref:GrpB family protein n=1 Tax=Desulfobotulus pelophilus TaxID=2823377 RepID=A0ABT3N6M8_9BACT|nr:GrpB family protein [Desulfobotulus pelophilus]MCW7753102.1 GrpB family protein [Desulfobotulus pelophilus]
MPEGLSGRIEHFGRTAVAGFPAKPMVDILVEVVGLDETKQRKVPILEAQGVTVFGDRLGGMTHRRSAAGL